MAWNGEANFTMYDEEAGESVLNEEVRIELRRRTRHVRTRSELVSAIFDSFRHARIDWRNIPLDDMKTAVLIAARAVRERGGASPENMPA